MKIISDMLHLGKSQNSWYNWHLYRHEIKHKYHKIRTSPIAVNYFVCESDRVISQCFWKKTNAIFEQIIVRMIKNRNGFIINSEFLILGNDKKVAEVCEVSGSYFTSMKTGCFHTKKVPFLTYSGMIITDEVQKTA